MKAIIIASIASIACLLMSSCATKVGSDAWCKKLKNTSKAEWSFNDTKNYAKHCILK